eukprot:6120573-Amphidinium_carterae.1
MEQQQRLAPSPSLRQQRYLKKTQDDARKINARRSTGSDLKKCLRDRHLQQSEMETQRLRQGYVGLSTTTIGHFPWQCARRWA